MTSPTRTGINSSPLQGKQRVLTTGPRENSQYFLQVKGLSYEGSTSKWALYLLAATCTEVGKAN